MRVFLGSTAGSTSPVRTFTPLLGAEILLEPGADVTLDIERGFEVGVLVDEGEVQLRGTTLRWAELGYQPPGNRWWRCATRARTPGPAAAARW